LKALCSFNKLSKKSCGAVNEAIECDKKFTASHVSIHEDSVVLGTDHPASEGVTKT
jgi:hypothetical protein